MSTVTTIIILAVILIISVTISVLSIKSDIENKKLVKDYAKKLEEQKQENNKLKQELYDKFMGINKAKEEADERKKKIHTGNHYDNYINGVNQLQNDSAGT